MSSIISDPTAEQLAKLPVWAQRHIAWLQQERADAARHISRLSGGDKDSDAYVEHYGVRPTRLLGKGTPVTFLVKAETGHEAGRITAQVTEHGVLEVRSEDGSLHITPQSSNVVRARIGSY